MTKLRFSRFAPLSALLVGAAALAAVAWRPLPSAPLASVASQGDETSPLGEQMETMNAALRFFLKTGASAENRAAALDWVSKLQTSIVVSKGLAPAAAAKVDEAARAEFVTGFRMLLVEVLATTCKLETALLEGKYDEANRVAREELTKLKKSGHDKYEEE
jgi:hypothetical protein